ncbi:MAG: hypothetical protein IJ763_03570 [Lachnospiraceae bacterium]|nr:hypothetical protein [Lachnospiraceae bacterium]
MKKIKTDKYMLYLAVIIFVQCIFIACCFTFVKQSFHSDEIWSYGLANSDDGPYVYMMNDKTEYKNYGQWMDSEVLRDYVTIDKNEIFNYKMVYDNCADDWHPPLYFMLLHFVSSFFLGKWSKWYAFFIDIIAFIITQIYLDKLIYNITKDKMLALLGTAFYGFTLGAVNVTIYLRNYSLCAAFTIMHMYYSAMVFENRDNADKQWKYIIKAAISCLLGCLTVHLNLLPAFAITLFYCIYYLFSKNLKLMFKYGISMALSVGLSFLLFIPSYAHIFVGGEGGEPSASYPMAWQFKIYWAYLQRDIIGFHNSIWPTMTDTYILLAVGVIIFIWLPFNFIARNEDWYKNLKLRVKTGIKNILDKRKAFPYTLFVLFAVVNITLLGNAKVTSIYGMGIQAKRYIFIIYAIYACFIVSLFYYPIKWLSKNARVRNIVISAILIVTITAVYIERTDSFFFIYNEENVTLDKLEDGANVVLVLSSPFLINCAAVDILDTSHYYLTSTAYYNYYDTYNELDTGNAPLYVVIDVSDDINDDIIKAALAGNDEKNEEKDDENEENSKNKKINYLKKLINYYNEKFDGSAEYVGKDCLYDRYVLIFKMKQLVK